MSRWTPVDDRSALVRFVTDRVADRLVEAIEQDEIDRQDRQVNGVPPLAGDPRRQQLLVGALLSERDRRIGCTAATRRSRR